MSFAGNFMTPAGTANSSQANHRHHSHFPDPYLDYASTQMPRSVYDVLRWAEYVYVTDGTYRIATQRVVRYFLTNIQLGEGSAGEQDKYKEFLEREIDIMDVLAKAGDNVQCYGNNFSSVYVPFRRFLRCEGCNLEQPISKASYKWENFKFQLKCDKCGSQNHQHVDRSAVGEKSLKIVHWPPHEIKILYHPVSAKTVYFWNIPSWFRQEVKKGNKFYLETTPWEFIDAIKQDKLFRFHDDKIHHIKEEPPSGIWLGGWGIPRVLGNFKLAWYNQILKRYNEAIALDYIMPFRVVTPDIGNSTKSGDPLLNMDVSNFQSNIMRMFAKHRKDPTTLHALPFPVRLDLLGAAGTQLAPKDLMDSGMDEFLNAQGVPPDLYRGNLTLQTTPPALRLFERTWVSLVSGLNSLLRWICDSASELQNWEKMEASLQPPTLAEDMERKSMLLQLAAGQMISKQTAWAPFGIDVREETKRMIQEQAFEQEELSKFQEEQAQKSELQRTMSMGSAGMLQPTGAPAPGGAAPPAGMAPGGAPAGLSGVTPEDMQAQADQLAQQLLGMPAELRRSELSKIKKTNESLHALVTARMDDIRQQAQTQGGYQLLQQQFGAGPTM